MANDPKKKETTTNKANSKENPSKPSSKKDDSKSAPTIATIDLGFLEEDDDFEEFPAEKYDNLDTEDLEPVNIWEDDWDDDNIEDDFSTQLKAEFEKRSLVGK